MTQIEAFNRALFLHINGGNGTPAWLIQAAIGIADDLIYLIPLLLAGLWLWGDHARRSVAIKACLVALLGVAANQAIGALWPHPRPFMIGLGHAWMPHAADSSFPSDHMTVFAGVGLTLLFDGAVGWAILALLVGASVAWARVFLGVHFPLDMAGAVVVAALAYAVVTPLWHKMGGPLTHLAERLYRKGLAFIPSTGAKR
ncbi:phosphatase PAP2 family protein [Pseudoduganella danionis]|uniref:Phosphatase PAP2 family protein n=1 Tax=Pseudoduganella danionis TaxID=1890295 RepID=A0ABW9SW45_9BURK|nr:phosphatase PAP2 family protein [Pseudoduganella danionis]MTW35368.1 phosphatase PAP2 family protein [Pseudoduganella danionis]